MNSFRRTIVVGAVLLFTASTFNLQAGGGWVKSKGQGYYKIGQTWVSSEIYFGLMSQLDPGLSSDLYTTSLYTEHGIGKGVSIEAYLPIYVQHSVSGRIMTETDVEDFQDRAGGLGDMNLGMRFQLVKKDYFTLSGTVTLGLPFGNATLGRLDNLFTGDNEFNTLFRLDASVPFGGKKVGGYGTVYSGFNNRNRNFSNELWYGGEIGISALETGIWLIGRVNAIDAFNINSDALSNGVTTSISFTTFMVETAFPLNETLGLSAGYTGAVSGNVLLVAPTYSVGLYMDIK